MGGWCVWWCALINSLFDITMFSFAPFALERGLVKTLHVLLEEDHDKLGRLHYKGRSGHYYPPICTTLKFKSVQAHHSCLTHFAGCKHHMCVCLNVFPWHFTSYGIVVFLPLLPQLSFLST